MISIIIPVYNSEKTIERLCNEIILLMQTMKQEYEMILVDDNSVDRSLERIKELCKSPRITGISLKNNSGQQNALLCGLRHSKGDYIVTIDDDLQYQTEDILKLYNEIEKGYDVVYGVPIIKEHGFIRNLGSRIKEWIFSMILGKPKDITITSFRIMRRALVEKIVKDQNSFVYLSAATFQNTKNVSNIKVVHKKRIYGNSNYSYFKLMKLTAHILIYYSNRTFFNLLKKHTPQYEIKDRIL